MKRIIILTTVLVVSLISHSSARPPSDLDISYDTKSELLTIEIAHVSKNPRDHHIRKVIISVNGQEVEVKYYNTQKNARRFFIEMPLSVLPGDEVVVKAICNEAGYKTDTLIIPEARIGR